MGTTSLVSHAEAVGNSINFRRGLAVLCGVHNHSVILAVGTLLNSAKYTLIHAPLTARLNNVKRTQLPYLS